MNVVFDLGGVVFDWAPDALLRREFEDSAVRELIREHILLHQDWVELDRGTIALGDAIDRGAARTGLATDQVADFFAAVPRSLKPKEETIRLIRSVRSAGHRVFVLSNMAHASIDYLEENHAIWDLFDGCVISCRVNKVKPESQIYDHLLEAFDLQASQTIFIDDMAENVAAASVRGIRPIQFSDPVQCRRELQELGCL